MDALTDLRWLAEELLSPTPADLPDPFLVSRSLTPPIRAHLAWWIRNPDPAGRFAAKTRWMRRVPTALSRRLLFALGYDGLIYLAGDAIIGHIFFQRRGDALHAFATAVADGSAQRGYGAVIVLDFIAYAARDRRVTRARIGAGRTPISRRMLERLRACSGRLGWRVDGDGWVTFR
jgi:hypothetical protein